MDEEEPAKREQEPAQRCITGHKWIGARVWRDFGVHGAGVGTITQWMAEGEDGPEEEPALWHVLFDDGDEEDLDEAEVEEAMRMFEEKGFTVQSEEQKVSGRQDQGGEQALEERNPECDQSESDEIECTGMKTSDACPHCSKPRANYANANSFWSHVSKCKSGKAKKGKKKAKPAAVEKSKSEQGYAVSQDTKMAKHEVKLSPAKLNATVESAPQTASQVEAHTQFHCVVHCHCAVVAVVPRPVCLQLFLGRRCPNWNGYQGT